MNDTNTVGIDARFFTEIATGVGRHVYELVNGLAEIDTNNNYIIFLRKSEYNKFKLPSSNFTKVVSYYPHYSFGEQISFCKRLYYHDLDLMIFPQFNVPLLYRRPYMVTIYDLTLHFFKGKKKRDIISRIAYKLVMNNAVRNAKHCFAVSENTKKDMIKYLKLSSKKITVAYNGISDTFNRLSKAELSEKNKKEFVKKYDLPNEYLLFLGVNKDHKNLSMLAEAFYLLLQDTKNKSITKNINLVIAGPKDKVYTDLDKKIDKYSLQNRICLLGLFPEEDISKLMCFSKGFVFPSLYEGFGIPPVEAMKCGVPVASSNTSSLPEACGDAAIYFNPKDSKSIKEALVVLLSNKKITEANIKKGLLQYKKFKWLDMVKVMHKKHQSFLLNIKNKQGEVRDKLM